MIYVPFAILLSIGLIFITVLGELKSVHKKKIAVINTVLSLIGLVIVLSTSFIAHRLIYHSGHDENLAQWAGGMLDVYYQISLPVFFVLLGITVLASIISIFDKKQQSGFSSKVRIMASCASSVILLIIAPFYGFMTDNASIPLYSCICWLGFGQALIMRVSFIVEYFARSSSNVKKL